MEDTNAKTPIGHINFIIMTGWGKNCGAEYEDNARPRSTHSARNVGEQVVMRESLTQRPTANHMKDHEEDQLDQEIASDKYTEMQETIRPDKNNQADLRIGTVDMCTTKADRANEIQVTSQRETAGRRPSGEK